MIKELIDGKFQLDIYPHGRNGKRIKRKFPSYQKALDFEKEIKSKVDQGLNISTQKERISDLVKLWFVNHGQTLNSGLDRYNMMLKASDDMGDILANRFTKQIFIKYRNQRLRSVTANTVNHELVYFRSMFTKLIELDLYHFQNPLTGIKRIKQHQKELSFLSIEQINELLQDLHSRTRSRAYMVAKICLATGARWSESESVNHSSLVGNQIVFKKTKNGLVRHVPISKDLKNEIIYYLGMLVGFDGAYSTFKVAYKKLNFKTPKGQLTHILRHTFASHFIMNGGNILSLQKILGHSSIELTMRYSHLSSDYLEEAIKLNPISKNTTS